MTKKDIGSIVKTALSLFLICAVAAGLVALVNSVTADKIRAIAEAQANEAKSTVLSAAERFEEITDTGLPDGAAGYLGKDAADGTVGYVFTTSASGYGGKIEVMTGFSAEGYITGVAILSIEETPGLGMNAKRDSFLQQFIDTDGALNVIKNAEPGQNEIRALTSATITSRAMVKAVNAARDCYNMVTGKGE